MQVVPQGSAVVVVDVVVVVEVQLAQCGIGVVVGAGVVGVKQGVKVIVSHSVQEPGGATHMHGQ